MPDSTPKTQARTERSYTNQSRKELPADHDYTEQKPYPQKRVSVPEFATGNQTKGEPKESPKLHQKEMSEE